MGKKSIKKTKISFAGVTWTPVGPPRVDELLSLGIFSCLLVRKILPMTESRL